MKLRRFRQYRQTLQGTRRSSKLSPTSGQPMVMPAADPRDLQPIQPARTVREARQAWIEGDWSTLLTTSAGETWRSDDPPRMALMVATAQLQVGSLEAAKSLLRDARSAGAGRQAIAQVLLASVHNTLGRVSALLDDPSRSLAHFAASVSIASPVAASARAIQSRARSQIAQLGLDVDISESADRTSHPHLKDSQALRALVLPWFTVPVAQATLAVASSNGRRFAVVASGDSQAWFSASDGSAGRTGAPRPVPGVWHGPLHLVAFGTGWLLAGCDPVGQVQWLALEADGSAPASALGATGRTGRQLTAVVPGSETAYAVVRDLDRTSVAPLSTSEVAERAWPSWAGTALGTLADPLGSLGLGLSKTDSGQLVVVAVGLEGSRAGQMVDQCRIPGSSSLDWAVLEGADAACIGLRHRAGSEPDLIIWRHEGRLRSAAMPVGTHWIAAASPAWSAPIVLLEQNARPGLWLVGSPAQRATPVDGLERLTGSRNLLHAAENGLLWIAALEPVSVGGSGAQRALLARVDVNPLLNPARAVDD